MEPSPPQMSEPARGSTGPTALFLIKVGEISLKGENRSYFEARLRRNIRRRLEGIPCSIAGGEGRFRVEVPAESAAIARERLATVFGITSYARAERVEKNISSITETAESLVAGLDPALLKQGFKVEARRTDKSFPYRSYDIARLLGAHLLERFTDLTVNVHKPAWILNVEIRERAYVYAERAGGPGGLPVGSAGRGVLLLSGGIDSPVAGYLMAKRGLKVDAVYFHAYPYTSEGALEKVKGLAGILAPFLGGVHLFVVPFTETQMRIKERAPADEVTLLMRACMMRIADRLAVERDAGCLITGESLSQVASQTMASIRFTESLSELPVFRPVIGMDKEEIIAVARRIGTFETSILPFDDCCTLFAPAHPVIHPRLEKLQASFDRLEIETLLTTALESVERFRFKP